MSVVQIDWKPDRAALRSFGRTVIIGSLLIAAVLHWGKGWSQAAGVLAVAGVVIGGLGMIGGPIARPGYLLWMGIAFVMGNIVSRVVLAVVYFLVVTPIGIVMKIIGRDRLALASRTRKRTTHWVDLPRSRTADADERQF
jgi:saxitoxin biosynthesis operon SxtJ-like protein